MPDTRVNLVLDLISINKGLDDLLFISVKAKHNNSKLTLTCTHKQKKNRLLKRYVVVLILLCYTIFNGIAWAH